jgi:hypothetical protein
MRGGSLSGLPSSPPQIFVSMVSRESLLYGRYYSLFIHCNALPSTNIAPFHTKIRSQEQPVCATELEYLSAHCSERALDAEWPTAHLATR